MSRFRHKTYFSFRSHMEIALMNTPLKVLGDALEREHAAERLAFTEHIWRTNETNEYMGRKAYVTPKQAAKLWIKEFRQRQGR